MQELHSTTTSSAHQLKVVRDSRAMGHKLGRGPPHFLGRQSLGSCCMLGGTVGLNPSISADPAFPNNFVELAGDSWLHGGGVVEKSLLPPSPPAVQTVMAQKRSVLPTRRTAGSQEGGVASAGGTSPTSMQTECTSTSLLQKSRMKKWQSLQAIGLRSKEKAETSVLPEQYPPQAQHRGIYSLLLSLRDSQGPSSECTWNISCVCTCLLV